MGQVQADTIMGIDSQHLSNFTTVSHQARPWMVLTLIGRQNQEHLGPLWIIIPLGLLHHPRQSIIKIVRPKLLGIVETLISRTTRRLKLLLPYSSKSNSASQYTATSHERIATSFSSKSSSFVTWGRNLTGSEMLNDRGEDGL